MTVAQARRAMIDLDLPYVLRVLSHAQVSHALLVALILEHMDDGDLTWEEIERTVGWAVLLGAIAREAQGMAMVTGQAATAVRSIAEAEGIVQARAMITELRPRLAPLLQFPATEVREVLSEARLRQILLDRYGEDAVRQFSQLFRDNLRAGMPVPIAARSALDLLLGPAAEMPGWLVRRSMIVIRKTNYDAFRGSMVRTYRLNLWDGAAWRWRSRLDKRVCAACLALHGRVFPLTTDFDRAHLGCRCLPQIVDDSVRSGATGEQWLRRQSPEVQDGILGKRGGQLFRRGDVVLQDFLKLDRHPVYGKTWRNGGVAYAERRAARRVAREKVNA